MSLTPRDRKIIGILIPIVLLGAYWFFGLAPLRQESTTVAEELTQAQGKRDTAQAQVGQLNGAKRSFAADYATVIRMGKAVPDSVDMPSLLVQLDRAARGTGVDINEITVDTKGVAAPAAPAPAGGGGVGAGGSGAQSPMGKAAQGAGNKVNDANAKGQAAADAASTPPAAPGSAAPVAPGLSSVNLTFRLSGDFFDLAQFFHKMKRFVRVVNDDIVIRGRLLTIDTFEFKPNTASGGKQLEASVGATVYLSPKAQGGVSVGASPSGPAAAGTVGPTGVASDPAGSSPSPSAPTATATP